MDLPFELRRQIFRYCIKCDFVIYVNGLWRHNSVFLSLADAVHRRSATNHPLTYMAEDLSGDDINVPVHMRLNRLDWHSEWEKKQNKSIVLVCKQASEDALNILYGENLFKVHTGQRGTTLEDFSAVNQLRVRKLQLVLALGVCQTLYYFGAFQRPELLPIWSNITKLQIKAVQPHGQISRYELDQHKNSMRKYEDQMRPLLKLLADVLPSQLQVELEDNGGLETRSLFEWYLVNRYKVVEFGGERAAMLG